MAPLWMIGSILLTWILTCVCDSFLSLKKTGMTGGGRKPKNLFIWIGRGRLDRLFSHFRESDQLKCTDSPTNQGWHGYEIEQYTHNNCRESLVKWWWIIGVPLEWHKMSWVVSSSSSSWSSMAEKSKRSHHRHAAMQHLPFSTSKQRRMQLIILAAKWATHSQSLWLDDVTDAHIKKR